jgi:site-specific recombinase XerD
MSRFISSFASKLDDSIKFRVARGYNADTHLTSLIKFDLFCADHFPHEIQLTQEIVHEWLDAVSETARYLSGYATAIRQFGKYLCAVDECAYVLPEKYLPDKRAYCPNVFTDDEISTLFAAIDALLPSNTEPHLGKIAPVLFRLIYTSGLRPNEGRTLLAENVNLETGEVLITHTKFNKERFIVMSDDMLDLARNYEVCRNIISSGNAYFFPSNKGGALSSGCIYSALNKAWTTATVSPQSPVPRAIRAMDLRHQFASACLQRWLDNGENLMRMLPYLQAYMGHDKLSYTAYYIHILPENLLNSSAIDWDVFNDMFPEVGL